jgi:hypothetical protein
MSSATAARRRAAGVACARSWNAWAARGELEGERIWRFWYARGHLTGMGRPVRPAVSQDGWCRRLRWAARSGAWRPAMTSSTMRTIGIPMSV